MKIGNVLVIVASILVSACAADSNDAEPSELQVEQQDDFILLQRGDEQLVVAEGVGDVQFEYSNGQAQSAELTLAHDLSEPAPQGWSGEARAFVDAMSPEFSGQVCDYLADEHDHELGHFAAHLFDDSVHTTSADEFRSTCSCVCKYCGRCQGCGDIASIPNPNKPQEQ